MSRQRVRFQGSFLRLARQMLAALLPFAAAVCYLLFGEAGGRLFLASLVVVPMLLLLAFAVTQVDQLTFSLEEGAWRRPLRKPIPADSLREVQFTKTMGMVQVNARTLGGGGEILLVALHPGDVDRLTAALENSSRTVHMRHNAVSPWKPVLVLTILLLAPFAAAYWYLLDQNPLLAEQCTTEQWPATPADIPTRPLAGWQVPAPPAGSGVAITPAPFLGSGFAGIGFLRVAGIDSGLELYRYACCARFGLVPLLLKSSLLSGKRTVRIREFESDTMRAVALIGEGGARPPILALAGTPGAAVLEIQFSVIDEEMLESILAGLKPTP